MRTIRPRVFETNSSSAHCIVVADKESFQKFKDGELFADAWWYKCPYHANLITFDQVYAKYINDVNHTRDWDRIHHYNNDIVILSKEAIRWLFKNPVVLSDSMAGCDIENYIRVWSTGSLRDELLEYLDSGYGFATSWVYGQYHPISYMMLRYFTQEFVTEYDDYQSEHPHENADGNIEMRAVWYF